MERMILIGAEEVQAASHRMLTAAEEMNKAVEGFSSSITRIVQRLEEHETWMDEWIVRFKEAVGEIVGED